MSYKIVELVLDNGPSVSAEKLLLVAIAESANDAGYCWPGLEKLARRCCRRRRHVIRLIQDLEVGGWLTSYQRAEGFGKKQTAYQLNVARLKTPFSGDAQIAHRISGDISAQSQVTFVPISGDISPLHILRNHEPSLEPSDGAFAPERELDFAGDYAQALTPKLATPVRSKPRKPTDEEVERVRLAYPRKVAAAAARRAIRAAIADLTLGKVTAASGEAIRKKTTEDAVSFLENAASRFGRSAAGMAGKHTPYPCTWFNGERYTEETNEWEGKKQIKGEPITLMPPLMSTADRARMQQGRLAH